MCLARVFISAWRVALAPRTRHVGYFEVARREDDGVGGRGHGQHEGKGGAQGARDHHVQRIHADGLRLRADVTQQGKKKEPRATGKVLVPEEGWSLARGFSPPPGR